MPERPAAGVGARMLDSTAAGHRSSERAPAVARRLARPFPAMVLQLIRKPHTRLHIGSGRERLEGWVNIDSQALPGVDVVADVTVGLQFSNVEAIFAEHFIEHLRLDLAVGFLREAWRVLGRRGALHLGLNRAFHGWRHQFLWNREMLGEALAACGFAGIRWCAYGESELPYFRGIERHETYGDAPELPHVIIVEACKGEPQPERLAQFEAVIQREFLIHLPD